MQGETFSLPLFCFHFNLLYNFVIKFDNSTRLTTLKIYRAAISFTELSFQLLLAHP